uniref:NADH-ubiquinone oxidoreductase chain 2 n=1 Tax=Oncocephalus breviscutum TaxID=1347735 RepID=U5JEL3_9HEMI|nr:NADH dehydrogenase subunit 2 [Oncocephalus breviscutum]AGO28000.1 NADH dehydrogenase subunit 2 [Oncocephalus breviscutum]
MLNTSMMLFYSTMIMGTVMAISSETWLGIWMGLEMNLISFVPILFKDKNKKSSESCMIYFLVQSLGSILMLISILSNSFIMNSPLMSEELLKMILTLSMLIKLGIPPFHFWFPEIMEKMTWPNCLILMTWQKIAPLTIISYIIENKLIPVIIIISTVVGAIGGLSQTSIRKIMAFSSINHMGWMLACLKFNNEFWMKYLMIYSLIILMMVFVFNEYSSYFINQLTSTSPELMKKSLIIMLLMSLGGLPPFMGFMPKWLVIQAMIMSNSIMIMMIMIASTLITLFYYLRLITTTLLINSTVIKWNQDKLMNKSMIMLMITINVSLPVMSTFSL